MKNRKQIYLFAYDVLIETLVNHQKTDENLIQLTEIAEKYNMFFNTEEFNAALSEKVQFYINQLMNEDDSLFIQDTHVPYLIKNNILVSEIDRLEIYIIIQFWVKDFKLSDPGIYQKLSSNLSDTNESENINQFVNSILDKENHSTFFKIFSQKTTNIEQLEGEWAISNMPEKNDGVYNHGSSEDTGIADVIFLERNKLFLISLNTINQQIKVEDSIFPDIFYLVKPSDTIQIGKDVVVSFAGLKKKLIDKKFGKKYYLTAIDARIEYSSKKGVKPFCFIGEPGELIGIIGREGSGKSAMLKLLGGYEKPKDGDIYINGYNLNEFYFQLSGLIGYVGEEDLLLPELSVYDNLAMAIRLLLRNSNEFDINVLVSNVLNEVGLFGYRNTLVGNENEKNLQPGQRWLLNIALELIRDPLILIIDNSKFPLSMSDSSIVLEVLTKLTFKGKLIITSITQTSSGSFENIDKILLLDNEGETIYFGDRPSALSTFKSWLPVGYTRLLEAPDKSGPELFLEILEYKKRLTDPKNKSQHTIEAVNTQKVIFSSSIQKIDKAREQKKIPSKQFHAPRLEKQFIIYSLRNFKIKIAKRKEFAFTLLAAPVFAIILAFIFRKSDTSPYQFSTNPNIPVFFFISILTTIFMGLILSIQDILKEKSILKKEMFLNLSLFSYINSKVFYLFVLLSLQTFLFTITANLILSIQNMTFFHWFIYFSSGAFGVILGLLFSSVCRNLNTVTLKILPFFIIFFLIFGCGWIPPANLNKKQNKFTPIVSDLMVSRWAYEAIIVKQFTDNPYQINFNQADEKISTGSFNSFHVLPFLRDLIEQNIQDCTDISDSLKHSCHIIGKRLIFLLSTENIYPFEYTDSLINGNINKKIIDETIDYITYIDYYFNELYNEGLQQKQVVTDSLNNIYGINACEKLKSSQFNLAIVQQVRNSSLRRNYSIFRDEIIQLTDPIFCKPINNFGRSTLFQRVKKFNNQLIDTFEFNLSVIWLFILIGYILLITNLINRLLRTDD